MTRLLHQHPILGPETTQAKSSQQSPASYLVPLPECRKTYKRERTLGRIAKSQFKRARYTTAGRVISMENSDDPDVMIALYGFRIFMLLIFCVR